MVSHSFFARSADSVARDLLGYTLWHQTPQGVTAGRIVETEAYLSNDPASHSFRGKTDRNKAMFGPAGTLYVYRIYGLHLCVNIVTGEEHTGEAVLIRALEPTEGIDLMMERRRTEDLRRLCRGPGCVAQAMGFTLNQTGTPLLGERIDILESCVRTISEEILTSGRIGIRAAAELPLRYFFKDNPFVSGPRS